MKLIVLSVDNTAYETLYNAMEGLFQTHLSQAKNPVPENSLMQDYIRYLQYRGVSISFEQFENNFDIAEMDKHVLKVLSQQKNSQNNQKIISLKLTLDEYSRISGAMMYLLIRLKNYGDTQKIESVNALMDSLEEQIKKQGMSISYYHFLKNPKLLTKIHYWFFKILSKIRLSVLVEVSCVKPKKLCQLSPVSNEVLGDFVLDPR